MESSKITKGLADQDRTLDFILEAEKKDYLLVNYILQVNLYNYHAQER